MNNELKNKTKQQLISEVDKLKKENSHLSFANAGVTISLADAKVEVKNLKKENKELKDNLELADSQYHDLRLSYQMSKSNLSNGYRHVLIWFTCSVIVNLALLLLLFLK